ncbi:hypothetical protein A1OE_522 [Candidatus Endolissoclinum faulkneri L2]|uniref:Uncharacterized protein n=1 Tax=Candidatus Endolissoclinum faulkneri L2 TaxID=1193729 RepID=K7YGI6_9PROT|nr:hypothetical protein A1OE_522 [Candidatus Endolissoclinum faulkneri L2]
MASIIDFYNQLININFILISNVQRKIKLIIDLSANKNILHNLFKK